MAPGAMVEGSKVEIEGEKCGLDMSSYEDLPPTSVGGDSNGDGKDDYVFVNGSDAGSDDHGESDVSGSGSDVSERKHVNGDSGGQSEVHTRGGGALDDPGEKGENGVVNFPGSNVETSEKVDNGHGDKVCSETNGDGEVLEVGNDGVDGERDNEGKVEGAELVKENGQVNPESEIVHEDVQLRVENGGTIYVESDVDVKVRELDVEGNHVNHVPNEVEDGEVCVQKEDNCNPSVDDTTTSVLDDDDKVKIRPGTENGFDTESLDKGEEVQNETPIVEVTPPISDEDQVKPPEVEDNIQLHVDEVVDREMEPLDSNVKDQRPSECDIECQLPEDGQSSDGEVKAPHLPVSPEPHSLDGDSTELLVGDVTSENQPSDDKQPESQPADEGNLAPNESDAQVKDEGDLDVSTMAVDSGSESCNLNQGEECEVKAQITTELTASSHGIQEIQTDSLQSEGTESQSHEQEGQNEATERGHVDPSDTSVNEEVTSLDSEAVMCELSPTEECDVKVQSPPELTVEEKEMKTFESDSLQSEEVGNQSGIESTAASVEGLVSVITTHVDDSETELTAEVGVETKKAGEKEKSDLIAEVAGNQESPVRDAIVPDQLTEETVSVNVTDNEISLNGLDSEKTIVVEELSSRPEIQMANDAALYEDRSDLGTVFLSEKVSDDQAVPALGDTPNDGEGSMKSEEGELSMPVASEAGLAASSVVDTIKEQAVDNGASAADTAHTLPQPKVECANGSLSDDVHDTNLKITETNGEIDVTNKSTCISTDTMKSKISFGSFVCEAPFSGNDVGMRPEVSDRSVELTYAQSNVTGANSESKISPVNGVATQNFEANGVHPIGLNHDKTSAEVPTVEHVNTEEVQSLHIPVSGAGAARGQSTDLVRRPFYYLVRIPRYEDVKLKELIRLSELQVAEKTQSRDAIRIEYQKRKGGIIQLKSVLEAAKSEERAARELVKAKRREIDSSQSLVNLAKNAITVEDVQAQILNMEHKIQHETLHLKEEKQLVREIKQMKNLKDQLYGNSQKQEELKQALDQKDQVEEHLKVLRKELASARDNLSKAEESVKVARKRYDEESASLNELYIKFTSADTVRQEAYAHLLDLKKQWSEKNKHFWSYKDAARAANNFVDAGDNGSLERHCVDQVEKFMELWDKNEEFRKEYIKGNTRSTLRRFGTLDGRSLGPDEEPPSIRNVSDDRATVSAKINSTPAVSTMERDFPAVAKNVDANPPKKVVEQKNKSVSAKKKAEVTLQNSSAEASGRIETEEEKEEHKPTKEEEELARRAEQQKREEEEARLREQRRQEEKAKAQEALERKKRMQEKARAKAEFKARKEAEEKEKEKEKRAKKKEKKQGVSSEPAESELAVPVESPSETTREPEVTERPVIAAKKPQKASLYTKQIKTTKSIPPALRNKGKRRMQQWMWALATLVAVLALFFLGNSNFLRNNNLLGFGPSY